MDPYIGITDFTDPAQVIHMLDVFRRFRRPGSRRRLHVGVMMSYKTLRGIETKWAKAFPPASAIADIFAFDMPFNALHYADYDGMPSFADDLEAAIAYGGPKLHAVQLDMTWPDPDVVQRIAEAHPGLEIILQIGTAAMKQANDDPLRVVERLAAYKNAFHRILLDKSLGKGLGMDAGGLLPFARAIREAYPDIGLVAAGGLGPGTLGLVAPLSQTFPDLSIDAQGRLRRSRDALDPIEWDLAEAYLIEALATLSC